MPVQSIQSSQPPSTRTPARARSWPWLLIVVIVAIAVIALRLEGRRWWCECGTVRPWISDIWTSHCSQHLFDPYALTHFSHGLIFCWALVLLRPRWPLSWQLAVAVALAAGWEVLENSPMIIERYRAATMSLNYLGDSIVNSLGDILACIVGFLVAKRIGFRWSFALFVVIELLLIVWMRDNLTVGTVMLLWPIDAVKSWQTAGAPITPM